MGDPLLEAVHLGDHRLQVLPLGAPGGELVEHELGRRPDARQGIAEPVGDGRRHLAERGELLGLDDRLVGAPEPLRHREELPGQAAQLVARPDLDPAGLVELATADHLHHRLEPGHRPGEGAGDERREERAEHDRGQDDGNQDHRGRALGRLQVSERARDVVRARGRVNRLDRTVERGQDLAVQLALNQAGRLRAIPPPVEGEGAPHHRVGPYVQALEDAREPEVVGIHGRPPPLGHPRVEQGVELLELVVGLRVPSREVVPHLAELPVDDGLDVREDARPGQALLERLQGHPLPPDVPEGLGSDDPERDDHDAEGQEQFLPKRHAMETMRPAREACQRARRRRRARAEGVLE